MSERNPSASVRPLIQLRYRHSPGWVSACSRFRFTRDGSNWIITDRDWTVQADGLTEWLVQTGLLATRFPRLRDAVESLEAHIAISPPPCNPLPAIKWRHVSPDRWVSPSGSWEIRREGRSFRTACVSNNTEHSLVKTLRIAKARTERLIEQQGPAA